MALLGFSWEPFEALWGDSWGYLGAVLGRLGALLDRRGASWGPLRWTVLGLSLGPLGQSWDDLGGLWAVLERRKLETSKTKGKSVDFASIGPLRGPLGGFCGRLGGLV